MGRPMLDHIVQAAAGHGDYGNPPECRRKTARFVSGHRFSDAVTVAKSAAPSGAADRDITFSAAC